MGKGWRCFNWRHRALLSKMSRWNLKKWLDGRRVGLGVAVSYLPSPHPLPANTTTGAAPPPSPGRWVSEVSVRRKCPDRNAKHDLSESVLTSENKSGLGIPCSTSPWQQSGGRVTENLRSVFHFQDVDDALHVKRRSTVFRLLFIIHVQLFGFLSALTRIDQSWAGA